MMILITGDELNYSHFFGGVNIGLDIAYTLFSQILLFVIALPL